MLFPRSLRIIGALLLFMGVSQVAFAQRASSMVYLGQANIDGQRDHDTIMVGREDGRFSSLQLRVENAPITFQRVIVHYNNGTSEEIQLRNRIPAGGQTRAIDLRGGDRAIQSVEFWYSRASRWTRSQPRVQLYGVNLTQVDNRPRPGRPGGWDYLGQANVDGLRDHDVITVGRDDGRFRSLQLRVEGAPIEFQRVVVRYANGTSEEIQLRNRIPAGGETRAIDLRGGDRAIQSVEFWYSRTNRARTQPRVQLYGANLAQVDNRPQSGGWDYLGQANVDGLRDRDVITVGRADGRFRSLQLRVEAAPIEFQRVVVHYVNGTSEELQLRDRIPAGGETRVIDLRGSDRAIKDVEFWYSRTIRWTSVKPRVHLYGR
jgi:hypothetical protein